MTRRALPTVLGLLAALLVGLLGGAASAPAADAAVARRQWAHVHEPDAVLRPGCHHYHYTYRVTAPSDQWLVELTLFNPNHHKVAGAYLSSESEPRRGHRSWMLCRPSTPTGAFLIRIKVTDGEYPYPVREARARPAHFRLTRA